MPAEFNEAMQNMAVCVSDSEINQGHLCLDKLGLPQVISGNFACVYRIKLANKDIAVRCFTRSVTDQAERYKRMSRFVCSDDLPYTIDFVYVENGILIKGTWYPLVKMDWIEGESLGRYVSSNLSNKGRLPLLRKNFMKMINEMSQAGIAHGDLQHGNLIIKDGEFILVDYDCVFVRTSYYLVDNLFGIGIERVNVSCNCKA